MIHDALLSRHKDGVTPLIAHCLPVTTLHHRLCLTLRHYMGSAWTIPQSHVRDWASATFCGARHFITLNATSSSDAEMVAIEKKLAALIDQDFDMAGHLVADIGVESHIRESEVRNMVDGLTHHQIVIHILTVEMD